MGFSDNLKNAIDQGGISQRKLARMTGLTEAAITRYIKGEREPRISQAVKIARVLGVTLDELFADHKENAPINRWMDTVPTTPKSSKFLCPLCHGIVYFQQSNTKGAPRACLYKYCPHCAGQVIMEE